MRRADRALSGLDQLARGGERGGDVYDDGGEEGDGREGEEGGDHLVAPCELLRSMEPL